MFIKNLTPKKINKILTGKYDSIVISNLFTLKENYSVTRGHNLNILKKDAD